MLKNLMQKQVWLKPLLYLSVCVLAFGLFIPVLGFYWDDWPTIFYTYNGRVAQLINHFSYDRPFSVWGYWLIGRLGTSPITWHLAALLIRWAIVLAFAWALKPLWPGQTKTITLLALLFAIYPGYYLQPSSVIFSSHLLALLFFLISLGAMGRAVTELKNALPYSFLAIAATTVHMFTLEYFVGLELVRPLYIWFLFINHGIAKRKRFRKLLISWAPYLAIAAAWIIWRLFLLKLPSEPYPLAMADVFRDNPLAGLFQLITIGVQDIIYVLVSAWADIARPALFQIDTWIDIVAWLPVILSFILVYITLARVQTTIKKEPGTETEDQQFAKQGMTLGILALAAGLLPVWMIGERIAQGDYNLRYILVAMFGASLVIGNLIIYFVREQNHRILIISLMVALAIGMHVRAANDYRLDWEEQRTFYWQLFWRAPDLLPNTALVSFDRATKYLGNPMTGNALNVLYPVANPPPTVDIWNFELTRTQTVEAIQNGEFLENDYRGLKFRTQSPSGLVFYFLPEDGCLWMLAPNNADNEYVPFENRSLVAKSNLATILPIPENDQYPDPVIFGGKPERDWCYYYEKADLARQFGHWDELIALMDEAKDLGLSPNIGIEWLPLVEAYAAIGDWAGAIDLSREIHAMHTRNDSMLCASWDSIVSSSQDAEDAIVAFEQVSTMAVCQQLK